MKKPHVSADQVKRAAKLTGSVVAAVVLVVEAYENTKKDDSNKKA